MLAQHPPSYSAVDAFRKLYRIESNHEEVTARVKSLTSAIRAKREGAEKLLAAHDEWEATRAKKEKLKRKALKIARKIVAQVVREADNLHATKTMSLAGENDAREWEEDEESPEDVPDTLSPSPCKSEVVTSWQADFGSPYTQTGPETRPVELEYDPDTAWKASCTQLPHISGKIRTLVLKKRSSQSAGRKYG